ncbi:MAG: LPS assembly lipoprotein LptE, partial [Woeseiaceae bacterium]
VPPNAHQPWVEGKTMTFAAHTFKASLISCLLALLPAGLAFGQDDYTDHRVLSVSARNLPREYEVYYTIDYSVESGDETIMEPQSLTLTRDYTYDETLVLGKAREEELLREAIVDDLVRIVLKQLSSL